MGQSAELETLSPYRGPVLELFPGLQTSMDKRNLMRNEVKSIPDFSFWEFRLRLGLPERFSNPCALTGIIEDGFFLRNKPLGSIGSGV